MFIDTQAPTRRNAKQLFAVGFAFSSGRQHGPEFTIDGARWFVMAKSPRLALREVLGLHAGEIATCNINAVNCSETVYTTNGFPVAGPNTRDEGLRLLYVCAAEDLPSASVHWSSVIGYVQGEQTPYELLVSLPGEKNGPAAKQVAFRWVRV